MDNRKSVQFNYGGHNYQIVPIENDDCGYSVIRDNRKCVTCTCVEFNPDSIDKEQIARLFYDKD